MTTVLAHLENYIVYWSFGRPAASNFRAD